MTRVRVQRSDDLCYFRVSSLESVINTTQTSSQSSEQSEINAFQGNDVLPPLTQCHDTRDRAWSRDAPLTRDNHPHPPQRDNSRVMNCVKASTLSVWLHITKFTNACGLKSLQKKINTLDVLHYSNNPTCLQSPRSQPRLCSLALL